MTKEELYISVLPGIREVLEDGGVTKESLLETASMLQDAFGFLWTGFYFVEDLPQAGRLRCSGKHEDDADLHSKGPWLVLGPSVGPPACEMIRYGRGVCGTAWKEGRTCLH